MRTPGRVLTGVLSFVAACSADPGGLDALDNVLPDEETDEPAPAESDTPDLPDSDSVDTDVEDTDPADTDTAVPQDTDPGPPPTAADCFAPIWGNDPPVDYDQFTPVMGRHCLGTNHQDIQGIERVVFIGDSITVGTLPTLTSQWYRNRVADMLARRYGLRPPSVSWRNADPFNGMSLEMFSGDFASCAKYGARTDDLLMDPHRQLETCMPEDSRDKVTLVVMTIGGNDIFSLLEDINAGFPPDLLRDNYRRATGLLRDAVTWIKEPGRFPNGVHVIMGNTFDFTDADGAEDMASCFGAQLIGLDTPLRDPLLHEILAEAQEEYLSIAVDTQSDLMFLGESFCGHGNSSDPYSRCYRGPNAGVWYDLTCEHPNADGHTAILQMVRAVLDE